MVLKYGGRKKKHQKGVSREKQRKQKKREAKKKKIKYTHEMAEKCVI